MRMMILTFELDDNSPVLAWQAELVRALAARCEFVLAVTQKLGRFDPPENTKVVTVPVRPFHLPQRFGSRWLMNFPLHRLCREHRIQAVFVHMAMEWTYILGPLYKLLRLPVLLWYAHGTVTNRLRLAHVLAGKVATSTPHGFRLPSNKLAVIGQGVNTEMFRIPAERRLGADLIYTGRISPRKRIHLLVESMAELRKQAPEIPFRLHLVGSGLTKSDKLYEQNLHAEVKVRGLEEQLIFHGFLPRSQLPELYKTVFLHINVSRTGSLDKTVLEALACGCLALTSNEAFVDLFQGYPEFLVQSEEPADIASQVIALYEKRAKYKPETVRGLIVGHHDLNSYADKVLSLLNAMVHP